MRHKNNLKKHPKIPSPQIDDPVLNIIPHNPKNPPKHPANPLNLHNKAQHLHNFLTLPHRPQTIPRPKETNLKLSY